MQACYCAQTTPETVTVVDNGKCETNVKCPLDISDSLRVASLSELNDPETLTATYRTILRNAYLENVKKLKPSVNNCRKTALSIVLGKIDAIILLIGEEIRLLQLITEIGIKLFCWIMKQAVYDGPCADLLLSIVNGIPVSGGSEFSFYLFRVSDQKAILDISTCCSSLNVSELKTIISDLLVY